MDWTRNSHCSDKKCTQSFGSKTRKSPFGRLEKYMKISDFHLSFGDNNSESQ
jgi:hypothetical protein